MYEVFDSGSSPSFFSRPFIIFIEEEIKMKKKSYFAFIFLGLLLCLSLFIPTKNSEAASIDLIGTSANDATVVTENGEIVTGDQSLDRWEYYHIKYNWKIPDNVTVHDGDTATVTLPNNVQIVEDTSFNLTDSQGNVIGSFQINKGSRVGTLTFNDYIEKHHLTDVSGTLDFMGNGLDDISVKDWIINKVGWIDGQNKPTWDIVYNPSGAKLTDVTITDTLDGNQKIDPDSIVIQFGTVDENNNFHMESEITDPIGKGMLTVTDNGFVAHLGDIDKAVQIVYNTTVTKRLDVDLGNSATGKADQLTAKTDSATIQVGGSGSASGTVETSWFPLVPATTHTTTSESTSTTTTSESTESTESTESSSSSSSESDEQKPGVIPWIPLTPATTIESSHDDTTTDTTSSQGTESSSETTTGHTTDNTSSSNENGGTNSVTRPVKQQDTVYESVYKPTSSKQKSILPQTGNKKQYGMMVAGAIIVIVVIAIIAYAVVHNRRKK